MLLDQFELHRPQFTWAGDDLGGDLQQADIVHHGRQSQRIQPLLPQLHGLPDGQRQIAHPQLMARTVAILVADGAGEGTDGLEQQVTLVALALLEAGDVDQGADDTGNHPLMVIEEILETDDLIAHAIAIMQLLFDALGLATSQQLGFPHAVGLGKPDWQQLLDPSTQQRLLADADHLIEGLVAAQKSPFDIFVEHRDRDGLEQGFVEVFQILQFGLLTQGELLAVLAQEMARARLPSTGLNRWQTGTIC